ncbi:hypothetical protein PM082_004188 [Marasmius tenuissimus]|nr:hypothetical protein PM082_004188 [Marasmius tenuissimus]
MQSFTGFKPSESVFDDVREACSLADRLGVPKTAWHLKLFEQIVTSTANHSLQDCILKPGSSSKQVLEDDLEDEGTGHPSPTSSKRSRSVDPDEDVEMDWGSDGDTW